MGNAEGAQLPQGYHSHRTNILVLPFFNASSVEDTFCFLTLKREMGQDF